MTLVELQVTGEKIWECPALQPNRLHPGFTIKKVTSIDEMTNLSLKYRELLKQNYEVGADALLWMKCVLWTVR